MTQPRSELVGTSSSTRTLDERDLASLRPALAPRPRALRKPSVLREVTNGVVCFCGERFGEAQALEFMLHLRAEVGDDLAILERRRERFRESRRAFDQSPEGREAARHRNRKYRQSEHGRKARREQDRERQSRPEVKARRARQARERRARQKAERAEAAAANGLD